MSLLLPIDNGVQIIRRSVREHATTVDCNEDGYVSNSGGNRILCSAVTTENVLVVYAETNGGPFLLSKFNEFDFASLVGDNGDAEQGLERLRDLAGELRHEDDAASEWLTECIDIAEAELQRQREDSASGAEPDCE